jgi:hypothetical protein
MLRHVAIATALTALSVLTATAQSIDFSGTWRLNKGASQIAAGAGLDGLGANGSPNTLYVTHAANGSVTIGSDVNESMARLYRIGGESSLPPAKIGGEWTPIKSRLEGRTLVSEGASMKEIVALSPDGETLRVTITKTTASGPATSTLVYAKMTTVDPCSEWPTPCQDNSAPAGARGGRGRGR